MSTAGDGNWKSIVLQFAYPSLRQLLPSDWETALKQARETDFDVIELIGILAGMTCVTYLLRFDAVQAAELTLPVKYFIQFMQAVPLLVLTIAPFHLRRTRRGLDRVVERRRESGLPQRQGLS